MFLSQVSEMQVHIWSTGQMLSDKFRMAKFIFLLFFDNILLIFVFHTVVDFLLVFLSGCWRGGRQNGAQGVILRALKVLSVFRVVHGHAPGEILKSCLRKLMSWVILRIFFNK